MSEQKTYLLGRKKQRWEKNERGLFSYRRIVKIAFSFPFLSKIH